MFLLDTDVVSALGPQRHAPAPQLADWLRANSDDLYLSTVSIAEFKAGAAKLERIGAGERSRLIGRWIEATVELFDRRILPFDLSVAMVAGALQDRARAAGIEPGFADVAIAATAERHDLTILTRNVRHFAPFNVPMHDPFAALPNGKPHGRGFHEGVSGR
jgi:predicted nucleic acid-binding protein